MTQPDRPEVDDPRVLALAKARQQMAYENPFNVVCPPWDGLTSDEQQLSLLDAWNYLRAALKAGLIPQPAGVAPATDRATLLRELADQQEATAATDVIRKRRSIATARRLFAVELRRMADEERDEQQAQANLDQLADLLPPTTDRAAVLREEAALIRADCPDHIDADSAEGSWMDCHCAVADDMERRMAAESVPADMGHGDSETEGEAPCCSDPTCACVQVNAAGRCDCTKWDSTPADDVQPEIVHGCPPDGSGLTPCCGRTPFELPRTDRISSEAPVTCPGPAGGAPQPKENRP